MAKSKKPAKKLGAKDLKKTKGGILIGLNQPSAWKLTPTLQPPSGSLSGELGGLTQYKS